MTTKRRTSEPVELYTSLWVSGTRAAAYFGPISSELFLKPGADEVAGIRKLFDLLETKAADLGANSVVGIELTLDPFGKSKTGKDCLHLHVVGTAARLEDLF